MLDFVVLLSDFASLLYIDLPIHPVSTPLALLIEFLVYVTTFVRQSGSNLTF